MLFNGLVHVVKTFMRKTTLTNDDSFSNLRPHISPVVHRIISQIHGVNSFYILFAQNQDVPSCKNKWQEKLNISISNSVWKNIFSIRFNITSNTNIQWFQYRIIHQISGTNVYLSSV